VPCPCVHYLPKLFFRECHCLVLRLRPLSCPELRTRHAAEHDARLPRAKLSLTRPRVGLVGWCLKAGRQSSLVILTTSVEFTRHASIPRAISSALVLFQCTATLTGLSPPHRTIGGEGRRLKAEERYTAFRPQNLKPLAPRSVARSARQARTSAKRSPAVVRQLPSIILRSDTRVDQALLPARGSS
jgi:hypothetical protein